MSDPYINLNMRPVENLTLQNEYVPTDASREKWDVKDNTSPSVLDGAFQKERLEHISKAKTKTIADGPFTIKIQNAHDAAILTDKSGRMVLSKQAMEDHMEERISAFLMQIIDCYDTDFHFTVGKTQDQTKSTSSINFIVERGIPKPADADLKMTFASAHHGTLPCIYAYPRGAWEAWKALKNSDAPGKPEAKVYLNKSDTYFLNNACTGVATIINQADIDVDGNPTEKMVEFGTRKPENQKKLREFTIELLNRAAKKEITPIQGLGLYMEKLKTIVDELEAAHPNGEKQIIFSTWKDVVADLDGEYQGNYKLFIAKLLGIRVPVQDRDAINLEEIVYPRHYKILQRKNTYQTELAFKIDQLKTELLEAANKKINNFDKAFKLALMKEVSSQDEKVRIIFQRYYNCSGQTLAALQKECTRPALKLVDKEESKRKIREFFVQFSHYIHNFTIDEAKFSTGLVKEIRLVRGLSLRKFSEKHNTLFPHAHPLNHEQLRRIELGCVQPTSGMIGRMAKVLKVHESVLKADLS